jgi:hypothetical protein
MQQLSGYASLELFTRLVVEVTWQCLPTYDWSFYLTVVVKQLTLYSVDWDGKKILALGKKIYIKEVLACWNELSYHKRGETEKIHT